MVSCWNFRPRFDRPRMLQSTWDFQELKVQCFSIGDFKRKAKRIYGFSTRVEKPTKNYSKLFGSFSALCPRWCITYRVVSSPLQVTEWNSSTLQVMWDGAVNRQPGYRARNLERRGYRAPPPRTKMLSSARRHHDRKFVFTNYFTTIENVLLTYKKEL